jgi:hypothetical protein
MTDTFDMPIKTGPQLWHHVTYSPLKKFEGQYYDSNGTRIDIKYEKGAMAAINTLSDTLRVWGSYCWSATVEESPELRLKCEAMLLPIIRMTIGLESRPDWWLRSADKLAVYAMREVRYERPPDGDNSRLSLYDNSQLSVRAGYTPGHFERDCGSQWRYLKLLLDGWCDQAAQPLEDWAREKRRAA